MAYPKHLSIGIVETESVEDNFIRHTAENHKLETSDSELLARSKINSSPSAPTISDSLNGSSDISEPLTEF
jgi:hypothetical protein